jgi:hypothetical protein
LPYVNRANVFEPIARAENRILARSGDQSFRNKKTGGLRVDVAVIGRSVIRVVLLSVFDPDFPLAERQNQRQRSVEPDVITFKFVRKFRITSQIVIVIADHHRDVYSLASQPELLENNCMVFDNFVELFDALNGCQFPETEVSPAIISSISLSFSLIFSENRRILQCNRRFADCRRRPNASR